MATQSDLAEIANDRQYGWLQRFAVQPSVSGSWTVTNRLPVVSAGLINEQLEIGYWQYVIAYKAIKAEEGIDFFKEPQKSINLIVGKLFVTFIYAKSGQHISQIWFEFLKKLVSGNF